jgi:hypothetical protein
MTESNRERLEIAAPAVAGVSYTVAWLAALAIWRSNPSVTASGPHVVGAHKSHEGVAIGQFVLAQGVAAAALAIVVVALGRAARRARVGRRLGNAAMIGGLVAVTVSLTQLVLGVLLAGWVARDGGTGSAHGLFEAINRLDGVKMFALAVMAGAGAGLALSRPGVLPPWLGGLGPGLCAALVVSGAGYLALNATLAMAAAVSLPLLLVWVTGAGLALGRVPRGRPARALKAA